MEILYRNRVLDVGSEIGLTGKFAIVSMPEYTEPVIIFETSWNYKERKAYFYDGRHHEVFEDGCELVQTQAGLAEYRETKDEGYRFDVTDTALATLKNFLPQVT